MTIGGSGKRGGARRGIIAAIFLFFECRAQRGDGERALRRFGFAFAHKGGMDVDRRGRDAADGGRNVEGKESR